MIFLSIKLKRKSVIPFMLLTLTALIALPIAKMLPPKEARFYTTSVAQSDMSNSPKKYIKWVDFNVPYALLEYTLKQDIRSIQNELHLNWIELIAYTAAKCGGNFKDYSQKTVDTLIERLKKGETIEEITANMPYYPFYLEAYTAVLGEFVGEYETKQIDPETQAEVTEKKYGLKVFFPIAKGYDFSHYKDFGASRNYGYKRSHLGHDMMGSIGTPIIAVESGKIEEMGWNQYGGWRIGIRSLDSKRYYYYAHLRKDHPYHNSLNIGDLVQAGDVIGYLGMTGYSTKENVNNMKVPHLHFGMQLIFDESQKESTNQIWIDVYNISLLLQKNKSTVEKDLQTKDYNKIK